MLLYAHFALLTARQYGVEPVKLAPEAGFQLLREGWSGNLRELKSRAEADTLGLEWANLREPASMNQTAASCGLNDELRRFEKEIIEKALLTSGNNIAEAARILQIPRRTLSEKISRLGI
ncbi:MAG: hypothetical protein NWR47_04770 [Aestuariivirgaceae bacterium]|nr:hypothetical protein [Aestuariivirgaceae bacterium]